MKRFLGSRLFAACVASTVTALIVGGVAFAVQSPVDGNGAVHACYNAKSGAMRLNVTGSCPKSGDNTPITWNVQGPKGDSGAQGAQGPPGPAGPTAAQCAVTDAMTTSAYTALQDAIDHATSGDRLDITGVCDGNFTINSGTLALMGMPIAALNANHHGNVLTIDNAGTNVTVTNLLITGGNAPVGGGIINFGTVTLTGNTQVNNNASENGGGIANYGTVTLTGNTQVNNNYSDNGGGINNTDSSTVILTGNTQVNNNVSSIGGGIINFGTVTLTGNTQIDNNYAPKSPENPGGGGIYNSINGTVHLTGSAQVEGNSGGGIDGGGTVASCEWYGQLVPNSSDSPPTPTSYGPPC